jgi:hypothetical protein
LPTKSEARENPIDTIAQIATAMQTILGEEADRIGRETGFIKREKKVKGSTFIQAMVYGFQSNPEMTYEELSQSAATIGLAMSAQGMEQRFCKEAAEFTQKVLENAVNQVITHEIESDTLIRRFEGVYLRDSSVIELPQELQGIWRGVGGSLGENSALKLQVNLNYKNGQLYGPILQNGRDHDQTSPYQTIQLPPGSLQLADLGYFSLKRFDNDQKSGVYWISRLKTGTKIFTEHGKPLDLMPWLQAEGSSKIDIPVLLGQSHHISCRLIVVRVPQEVADQRRRRMRNDARKKRQPVTQERLALAMWTIVVTNIPKELLSAQEVFILLRVRWQIELLFKLWKSHAKIDEWRSSNPWRILCEIYAKLLGIIISHWILITSIWKFPDRSLFKAVKTIQKFATAFAISSSKIDDLIVVLRRLQQCLEKGCRAHPATFQLLLEGLC